MYPAARFRFHERFQRALAEGAEQRLELYWDEPAVWLSLRFLPRRAGITVLSRNVTEERELHHVLIEPAGRGSG